MNPIIAILLTISFFQKPDFNDSVFTWLKKDATVWSVNQTIKGKSNKGQNGNYWLFHNGVKNNIVVQNGEFELPVKLEEIHNQFWMVDNQGSNVFSDTLTLILGYKPIPILKPILESKGDQLILQVRTLENPLEEDLILRWESETNNPEKLKFQKLDPSKVAIPMPSKDGDYWVNISNHSNFGVHSFKAMFRKLGENIRVFGADNPEHPWMDKAILYQLSPYNFTENGGLDAITEKLEDIADLGINTLYLQPIFLNSRKGQGYDIVNYFKLNPAYGNEENLRKLMDKAKLLGMRVLFDLVINHSSIHHPYAKDRIEHGKLSHYDDFYHTTFDGAKYSSNYNADEYGFINYFWKDLVNLNYDNEEVQRWMLEACKYWVNAFDIDGYRFDAIWGVMARKPEFGYRLREELKAIKPDIFMLAEAKGREADVYTNGYDAAYDWTSDTLWVSQWSWEYEYNHTENKTAFNHPESSKRVEILSEAIFDNLEYAQRILRFTENNDLPRFPVDHGLERSKLASALVFSLPGIPMIYQGQEIGALSHPYTSKPVFSRELSIREQGGEEIYDFYKTLIKKRKSNPALSKGELVQLDFGDKEIGFLRKHPFQEILIVFNPGEETTLISLENFITGSGINSKNNKWKDILKNEEIIINLDEPNLKLAPGQILWLIKINNSK